MPAAVAQGQAAPYSVNSTSSSGSSSLSVGGTQNPFAGSVPRESRKKIAQEGNTIVVGRGALYFLRDCYDIFHVFLYAPRAERIRRIIADRGSPKEAEDLVDTVDREPMAFIKHYLNADRPTRALYHMMLNTAVGDELVSRRSWSLCAAWNTKPSHIPRAFAACVKHTLT